MTTTIKNLQQINVISVQSFFEEIIHQNKNIIEKFSLTILDIQTMINNIEFDYYSVDKIAEQFSIKKSFLLLLLKPYLIIKAKQLYIDKTECEISKILGVSRSFIHTLVTNKIPQPLTPELSTKMQLLFKEGKSIQSIIKNLNLRTEDVYNYLYGNKIILEYMQGKSVNLLRVELKTSKKVIGNILKEAGIDVQRSTRTVFEYHLKLGQGHYHFWRVFTPIVEEVLIGELLGDGCISPKNGIHAFATMPSLEVYEKSLHYIAQFKLFNDLSQVSNMSTAISEFNTAISVVLKHSITRFSYNKSIYEFRYLSQGLCQKYLESGYTHHALLILCYIWRSNKYVFKFDLYTQASVQLAHLYKLWYPDGVKIVPINHFSLTSTTLLCWYIGDGTYSRHYDRRRLKETYYYQIYLYTYSFSFQEVELLIKKLEELQIYSTLHKSYDKRYPDKTYYMISIQKKDSVKKFFECIDQADHDLLQLAKAEFPWKFHAEIRKRDIIKQRVAAGDILALLYSIKIPATKLEDTDIKNAVDNLVQFPMEKLLDPSSKEILSKYINIIKNKLD